MKAVVGKRGQVTIPKALRESFGIKAGTVLDFWEDNGKIVVQRVMQDDPVTRVRGCLKLDKPTDQLIAEMRDGTE